MNNRFYIAPDLLLDLANERLLRGSEPYPLRPKTFAVLKRLVTHSGRLVTKAELLDDVWSDSCTSDMVLKVSIREIRKALDDDSKNPRFIETAHGRGYRFIGSVTACASSEGAAEVGPLLCGRGAESARLHDCLAKSLAGERQVVFILGEPGVGKTALVDGFFAEAEGKARFGILRGRCQAFLGAEHPFFPVLDSLERLARSENDGLLRAQLERHAPSWLTRLPSLLEPDTHEALKRRSIPLDTPHLGELVLALERYTDNLALVQVLEDLDHCDSGTLDLVLALSERREKARHLLIVTSRPPEQCPDQGCARIYRQLSIHGRVLGLRLGGLDVAAVREVLARRLAGQAGGNEVKPSPELATWFHTATEGNPLYLESLVDTLLEGGELVLKEDAWHLGPRAKLALPRRIVDLVEERLVDLSAADRQLLEAASAQGSEITAPKLAVALGQKPVDVETRLEILSRRGLFLRRDRIAETHRGDGWGRYGFLHTLEQRALAARLTPAQHGHFAKVATSTHGGST